MPVTLAAIEDARRRIAGAALRLRVREMPVAIERRWQTCEERAYPGVHAAFVHAFDDADVMAGNGTIGLEILEDLPEADAVVIPWGGGGLTCGIAAAVRAKRPGCRLYAAEVATAAPLAASLADRKSVV